MPPPPPPKKFNFIQKKKQAVNSIKEVNYFLNNLNKTIKGIKLYNWFK